MIESPRFDDYFQSLHGYSPFPWQSELSQMLVDGRFPKSISAPPGLGKTASLDAWMWALAVDISRNGTKRTVPLRAVFVVDRRGIVDAAFEHAQHVSKKLDEGRSPEVEWVAAQLKSAGHELRRPLEVVRMRGGVSWASRWLRQPDQPAVVAGTVDQFGSRFLFRGYGVSERMRPIDAALVGTDVIAFLDEAHLSTSLVSTVRDCVEMESAGRPSPVPYPVIVPMSATPSIDTTDSNSLGVTDKDRDHPVAGPRIRAAKLARLIEIPASLAAKATAEMARKMTEEAALAASRGQVALVVCNTIGLAREVHRRLTSVRGDRVDARLSIGRGRELDKEVSRASWWDQAKALRADRRSPREKGLVIVSTQTVEVGADLDVDTLITEAAPLDALIQRFGRVDRVGELQATESVILYHPIRSSPEGDFVYGAASSRTWDWLASVADSLDNPEGVRQLDLGTMGISEHLEALSPAMRSSLIAPLPPTPALYPALLDKLAQTDPTNGVPFPVDTYLHGLARTDRSVSVVWRADLVHGDAAAQLRAVPPSTAEAVDVPLEHFRRMWTASKTPDGLGDVDVPAEPLAEDPKLAHRGPVFPCWAVRDGGEVFEITRAGDIRPGEMIVIPSSAGGHDEFGWVGVGGEDLVPDISDLVNPRGSRLRIDEAVLESLGISASGDSSVRAAVSDLRQNVSDDSDGIAAAVHSLVQVLTSKVGDSRYPQALVRVLDCLCEVKSWSIKRSLSRGWVEVVEPSERGASITGGNDLPARAPTMILHAPATNTEHRVDRASVVDTQDSVGTSLTGFGVPLSKHLQGVGQRSEDFAKHLGLTAELCEAVRLAGHLHDLGKIDERFQSLLRGGDWLTAAAYPGEVEPALAKSESRRRVSAAPVPEEWKWPKGMRHEAISLALVQRYQFPTSVDRELVEHLVAAHHGWSRPLFPAVLDGNPRMLDVEFDGQRLTATSDDAINDWGSIRRFNRLCQRYGWWGLAALESMVRLADMAVSEEGS